MAKTEMHPIGLWASFFDAIKDYKAFLQNAVDVGKDARSIEGNSLVSHEKAAEYLPLFTLILEQEYWLAPHDGNLFELEDYCKGQEYTVESLIQAAIWFQANKLRTHLDELGVTGDEADSVMRAIRHELKLDERQKVIEQYLYARSLDRWFQEVKNTSPTKQTEEPATLDGKVPGGFIGFCYRKIAVMPTEDRERFLSVNSGDSSFYELLREWNAEWASQGKKAYKKPGEGVAKAKQAYRKLNPELKN